MEDRHFRLWLWARDELNWQSDQREHEVMLFSAGNFSDSSSLHGGEMPGVKELAAGAAQTKIEYTALPDGAQITFTTQDLQLTTAIHRWFGAQLSDHGSDATYR